MNALRLPLLLAFVLVACTSELPRAPSDALTDTDTGDAAAPDGPDESDTPDTPPCSLAVSDPTPPYLTALGCPSDFDRLASRPLDASIPGARSVKTVLDRIDGALYFQDSNVYPLHYAFCSAHLSGNGKPPVPPSSQFNQTEYYSPARRFVLGALTHYELADRWVWELSPYDTASPDLLATSFSAVRDALSFDDLAFHPTSSALERTASLVPTLPIVTTEALFAGIAYQPLNLATGVGRLRFLRVVDLAAISLDFRDILVLDRVPNDLSVVAGLITEAPQTPLAHVNVLSQNRGTPNMSLSHAFDDPTLRALEGRLVELEVGPFDWRIREISQADAESFWDLHKPPPVPIAALDLTRTDVLDIREVTRPPTVAEGRDLRPALDEAIAAYGGKASHYSALTQLSALNIGPAFAIPVVWSIRHLEAHGLDRDLSRLLADLPALDAPARKSRLAALRTAILAAPLDPALASEVRAHLQALPTPRARFRSSTNAEDLDGMTGAGLYESASGDPNDPDNPIDLAIKTVWASLWRDKAFDERTYRNIDHRKVGMAVLVSPAFSAEEANGVAITANLFDRAGTEPGFVINVQRGGTSVVLPPPGVTSDYFVYLHGYPGQPMTFLTRSNLVAPGATVLTPTQANTLGTALQAIHTHFSKTYAMPGKFYGMDVEFKFDGPPAPSSQPPVLWIKQARPHPGWGLQP
jgi:hypothetical protein